MVYLYLGIAIVGEVVATSALKASESFTKPLPSLLVVAGYGVAFYFLSVCLKSINVGVAYAIWSGLGLVLVSTTAAVLYKQVPDGWAILGMALIVAGVLVLNLLSKSGSLNAVTGGEPVAARDLAAACDSDLRGSLTRPCW